MINEYILNDYIEETLVEYKTLKLCSNNCSEILRKNFERFSGSLDNLFVIKCNKINLIINKLEENGWAHKIKSLLMSNADNFNDMYTTANAEYVLYRHFFIKENIEDEYKKNEMILDSSRFGIENVNDMYEIKCLHKHYAHYVATGNNPVGKIVDMLINKYIVNNRVETDFFCNCK